MINDIIRKSIEVKENILLDKSLHQVIYNSIDVIVNAFQSGKKVMFCGNGGSAADAQHLAAELSGRFYKDRKALPSDALHCNTSYLTAVANDYSYDVIYSRLIEGLAKPGDVLVGLSTSGNSEKIVKAGLIPDSQRYFDYHHAANDKFDAVDKRELELGAATMASLIYLIDQKGIIE